MVQLANMQLPSQLPRDFYYRYNHNYINALHSFYFLGLSLWLFYVISALCVAISLPASLVKLCCITTTSSCVSCRSCVAKFYRSNRFWRLICIITQLVRSLHSYVYKPCSTIQCSYIAMLVQNIMLPRQLVGKLVDIVAKCLSMRQIILRGQKVPIVEYAVCIFRQWYVRNALIFERYLSILFW